ncbi:Predicted lysozyme (DUF847) [Leminorella richardii]|uniref:Predicted lysozyme (DUF847) n=1 Tax=Leminorella richardii TaxID=158841 RepID=A0A2X4U7L5_9GAMM|nr:N-acetylmuramidase [Leminorella richardii]SQI34961.1 Predicted lysozyme (DUF847) [Leminorella richardii]
MSTYHTDSAFVRAINYLLGVEGGYVNDPVDRGGETKFGISKRAYPHLNIATLTREQAAEIYYTDYWLKARCNKLPFPIALMLFDAAVNHGLKAAVQQLQRAVRVSDDGIIGTKTLEAVRVTNSMQLMMRLTVERSRSYAKIIAGNPNQKRFLDGWFNRLIALVNEVCLDF